MAAQPPGLTVPTAIEHERVVRWDDPEIGIAWPLDDGAPLELSEKDLAGLPLSEADLFA